MSAPVLEVSAGLPPSDHTLVRYIRGGDETAAAELYLRYATRVRQVVAARWSAAFAARFDPDDVVQSVFRILYEGVRSRNFDVPKGGELWGLLSALAVNKARDQIAFHRAAKRDVYRTSDPGEYILEGVFARDEETAALIRMVVDEYLRSLPEFERSVLALRMTGHTVGEISGRSGRAVRSVERALQQVRDRLADLLRS
jgi:RNA polymerase sigma-70 factor (ECF subfamily)